MIPEDELATADDATCIPTLRAMNVMPAIITILIRFIEASLFDRRFALRDRCTTIRDGGDPSMTLLALTSGS